MNKIDAYVYLGDLEDARQPDTIEVVLSVLDFSMDHYKVNGIEYHFIFAEDSDDEDLLTHFPRTNQLISEWIEQKRSILVHCLG